MTIIKTATTTTEVQGAEVIDMINTTKTAEVAEDTIEVAVDRTKDEEITDLMEISRIIKII